MTLNRRKVSCQEGVTERDFCNKAQKRKRGRQTKCVKTTTGKCSRGGRDAHYRAIDRPAENGRNGREGEIRDNREENSFLLAPKETAGAGKRRQSLDL